MAQSAIPLPVISASGVSFPTYEQVLVGAISDVQAAFGGQLAMAQGSPEYQLAEIIANAAMQRDSILLEFTHQIDPRTATGVYQDALARLYNITRNPALYTTITVRCFGRTGAVIPIGSSVIDPAGFIYLCTAAGTIPVGGYVDLPFACTTAGPVQVAANVIKINASVSGWDTANNPAQGVPGAYAENRADLEYRRRASIARNGTGQNTALMGEITQLPGVTDCYVIDNKSASPVVIDGVTLLPHSIYACVAGGSDADIAGAMTKVSDGCQFTGNTPFSILQTDGYVPPYPVFTGAFQRPTDLQVYFSVTARNLTGQSNAVIENLIKAAILQEFQGGGVGEKARIGGEILAGQYYPVAAGAAENLYIQSLFIGLSSNPTGDSVQAGIDDRPVCSSGNISITWQ